MATRRPLSVGSIAKRPSMLRPMITPGLGAVPSVKAMKASREGS